ncbi:MAG TPA: hypothetical protein VNK23_02145 [Candidatus Dormibacteraeota bacterium]|nr:hypothetical protein [Candidatus Dormibacteraeota bacterium]
MKFRFAFAGAAVLSAALAICSFSAWPQNPPRDAWASKYFPQAFDKLFPIKRAEGDFIAVRAHRSNLNDLREYSIVFENAQDSKSLRAVVREAEASSLYQQLAALHAAHPEASYDQLKSDLKVEVWTLTPERCPAVSTQFKAFENVQFTRPRDDDEPEANPVLYEFNESLAGGGSVLEYVENRSLPRWTRATHAAFDACIASGHTTAAK